MTTQELTHWLQLHAQSLGFASVGVIPAVTPPGAARLDEWLEAGYAGGMHYLGERREAYDHPRSVLDGVRSVMMMTLDYRTATPQQTEPGQGRVSRYAWGERDYHDTIHDKLKQLRRALEERVPEAKVRGVVDTAPLMERDFAQLAGLGWIGKHTLLLNRAQGSWFFLAALLTDIQLDYNTQAATDHCGTCTACLDVCPTDAFPQPHVLDASRCISYLTIEHKGAIPTALRKGIGDWVFGCDLCQEVCPWNNRASATIDSTFAPQANTNPLELVELFSLNDDAFRERFKRTPLWRPRRRGILRNAAIALGNRPASNAVAALVCGLNDEDSVVRGASAWALRHYQDAENALTERLAVETNDEVREEIQSALAYNGKAASVGR